MTLALRDTLTRAVRADRAARARTRSRMYTCGPTVYRYAHVGNLRSYLLADLIRRVLLHHGLDVLHVKNITDVGHLRDERFDRGEDRMLVAGRSRRPAPRPRSPMRTRPRSTTTRRRSTSCPPTSSRGRPSTSREMVALAERLAGPRLTRTPRPHGTSTTTCRPSTGTGRCRATRSTTCEPATAARSSRTSATRPTSPCGRQPARAAP